jgi:hypothetical protein
MLKRIGCAQTEHAVNFKEGKWIKRVALSLGKC